MGSPPDRGGPGADFVAQLPLQAMSVEVLHSWLGSPMPNRSAGRDQTNSDPVVLPVCCLRLCVALTILTRKKKAVTEYIGIRMNANASRY